MGLAGRAGSVLLDRIGVARQYGSGWAGSVRLGRLYFIYNHPVRANNNLSINSYQTDYLYK